MKKQVAYLINVKKGDGVRKKGEKRGQIYFHARKKGTDLFSCNDALK